MTPSETEALRQELREQCDLRHQEANRRLDALEQGQRARDEQIYKRVNTIAESQAAVKATVDTLSATVTRMEGKLDALKDSSASRAIEDKSKGNSQLVLLVIALGGWALTILLFALGVLKP